MKTSLLDQDRYSPSQENSGWEFWNTGKRLGSRGKDCRQTANDTKNPRPFFEKNVCPARRSPVAHFL